MVPRMNARLAESASNAARPRRVLIVSYWFPPFQAIAALRMGKLAKHLLDNGWDVRVLTADATDYPGMTLEIPRERVRYTPWTDVDRTLENALGRLRAKRPPEGASPQASHEGATKSATPSPAWRRALRNLYQECVRLPDNRAGWTRPALAEGDRLIATWRPDVIYATSPPPTSLIVADRLARKHAIPWVAEFRDLWSDNPYYEYSPVRHAFERVWDQRVLTRAAAIVTVSPVWQPRLEARYGRPVITAMNGFVPEDLPKRPPVEPEATGPLRIVYTGHIYHGRRDPTPLFAALREAKVTPADVVVEFIGSGVDEVERLAAQTGVLDLVHVLPPVEYRDSLGVQLHADILLHLQWCDPREEGTIAGKLFDYLAARRPILGIALEDSIAAKLIRERAAGLVTNDPAKIAAQLAKWLAEKRAGGVPPLPAAASEGLERAAQFEKIALLLANVTDKSVRTAVASSRLQAAS